MGRWWQKGNWDFGTEKFAETKATTKDFRRGAESAEKAKGKEVSAQAIDRVGAGGENAAANGTRFEKPGRAAKNSTARTR